MTLTAPVYEDGGLRLWHGPNMDILPTFADASFDSIVTDPPYELGFMGKGWDSSGIAYDENVWRECLRVLKPGGHLLAFGGSRTWHRMAVAIEDAGFEMRDSIAWLYGSGFPKSRNVLKPAFEPIVVARKPFRGTVAANVLTHGTGELNIDACRTAWKSESDKEAGRPASFAKEHTGFEGSSFAMADRSHRDPAAEQADGRWPTNVILDDTQAHVLDAQSGNRPGGSFPGRTAKGPKFTGATYAGGKEYVGRIDAAPRRLDDTGGASRFFPVFAAPPAEIPRVGDVIRSMGQPTTVVAVEQRNPILWAVLTEHAGGSEEFLVDTTRPLPTFRYEAKAPTSERPNVEGTVHATVKPLALIRWLVRLVTRPGGRVLDLYAGSGTTGEAALLEGMEVDLIELEKDHLPLILARVRKPLHPAMFGDWEDA